MFLKMPELALFALKKIMFAMVLYVNQLSSSFEHLSFFFVNWSIGFLIDIKLI